MTKLQAARIRLNSLGYAFWYDARRRMFRANLMGSDSPRYDIPVDCPVTAYRYACFLIGIAPINYKPLTFTDKGVRTS